MASYDADAFDLPREAWLSTPRARFEVKAFCLDKNETTEGDYQACITAGACTARGPVSTPLDTHCHSADKRWSRHPVTCVSQPEASAFCQWQHKRLPTSNEFIEAFRGGHEGRVTPWGTPTFDASRGNGCGRECQEGRIEQDIPWWDAFKTTAPVGSFPHGANPQGVLDLVGNVSEWSSTENRSEPATIADHHFVIHGSSWQTAFKEAHEAPGMGSSRKHLYRSSYLGLRCARSRVP